jgi:DNA-binding response OmpR family regulator
VICPVPAASLGRLSGFEVATAADGSEAIRTLASAPPDAVILDAERLARPSSAGVYR